MEQANRRCNYKNTKKCRINAFLPNLKHIVIQIALLQIIPICAFKPMLKKYDRLTAHLSTEDGSLQKKNESCFLSFFLYFCLFLFLFLLLLLLLLLLCFMLLIQYILAPRPPKTNLHFIVYTFGIGSHKKVSSCTLVIMLIIVNVSLTRII